jgi:hypothetical protein
MSQNNCAEWKKPIKNKECAEYKSVHINSRICIKTLEYA